VTLTTPLTITLEAKQIGRKATLVPSWNLELHNLPEPLTLRILLKRIVISEVEAYNLRQKDAQFVRTLTQNQLESAAEVGKIDMGGRETEALVADPQATVETALLAFTDGLYYVFLNDHQLESLEEEVRVSPQMSLLFLRLVALAGG
jgi:hypothetical protein